MYGADDYFNQVVTGHFDDKKGLYITDDGKEWKSVGLVDYGNNNCFEVMVLATKPLQYEADFQHEQYPVYLASHDEDMSRLGTDVLTFLGDIIEEEPHHMNAVLLALGSALDRYK